MHSAALAPGALDGPVRGGAEPGVSVGYHQAHPGEPSGSQRAQEVLPEGLGFAVADVASQDLPVAVGGDAGGDDHRHRGDL